MLADMPEESAEGETLHLHASVGDITVEVEGPIDEAETWFEALQEDYLPDVDPENVTAAMDQEGRQTETTDTNESPADPGNSTPEKSRSLAEYYKMADDLTKKDGALIVGWYLEYHEDEQNFTPPEVEDRAGDAKINIGANVTRDLSDQAKDGLIKKDEDRSGSDAYHLTLTGEQYVKDELLGLVS